MEMTLGRHQEHDPRSLVFSAAQAAVLKTVMWQYHGQVLDQGSVGSCTGNSAVEVMMTGPYFNHLGKVFVEADAVDVYSMASSIDTIPGSYPPDDTGSSGLAVMKALKKRGFIRTYQHAFGLTHAMRSLMLGPLITGTVWMEGMFKPDKDNFVTPQGDPAGGHEYTVLGYDLTKDAVRFLNHWTAKWGDGGYFWMKRTDWGLLLAQQGDVSIPVM